MSLVYAPDAQKHVANSLKNWSAGFADANNRKRAFDAWLFLNASSVLLSEKTGELLSIDLTEIRLSATEVSAELSRLAAEWSFSYKLLLESNQRLKFVVFQKDRLEETLMETPMCILSGKLGYAQNLSAESFLSELKKRWIGSGEIPHEIGLALGYPIKDVFGFMGLLPLPCKGVCGWRVYGCMAESKRRSSAFTNARCRALAYLSTIHQ